MFTISELKKQLKIKEHLFFNDSAPVFTGRYDDFFNCIVLENGEKLTDAGDGRYISENENTYNLVCYCIDHNVEVLGYALESERTYKDAQYYENVIIEILQKIGMNEAGDLNDFSYCGTNYQGIEAAEYVFIKAFIGVKNITIDTPEIKEKIKPLIDILV